MDIEGKVHYDSGDREIRIRDIGNYEKTVGTGMVAPDKKTLKKSVKSMFFMVQTRCEVETIKY